MQHNLSSITLGTAYSKKNIHENGVVKIHFTSLIFPLPVIAVQWKGITLLLNQWPPVNLSYQKRVGGIGIETYRLMLYHKHFKDTCSKRAGVTKPRRKSWFEHSIHTCNNRLIPCFFQRSEHTIVYIYDNSQPLSFVLHRVPQHVRTSNDIRAVYDTPCQYLSQGWTTDGLQSPRLQWRWWRTRRYYSVAYCIW